MFDLMTVNHEWLTEPPGKLEGRESPLNVSRLSMTPQKGHHSAEGILKRQVYSTTGEFRGNLLEGVKNILHLWFPQASSRNKNRQCTTHE